MTIVTATTVTRNKRRNSIVLEGWSTTNRNKKLIIKGIIDINYWDSNYSYKKQVPITASFSGGFYSSLKILDEACFMLKKASQFSLTIARNKSENETCYLNYLDIVWYLFLSEKKKEKYIPKKLRSDDLLSWSQQNFR